MREGTELAQNGWGAHVLSQPKGESGEQGGDCGGVVELRQRHADAGAVAGQERQKALHLHSVTASGCVIPWNDIYMIGMA